VPSTRRAATVQLCVTRSYVWDCGEQTGTTYTYSGTGTLVPRGPYACTEQASVERARRAVAIGNSRAVDSDVAVEEARRGSRIRLVLGGDLHRLAGLYGFAGAGRELVLHGSDRDVMCNDL